MTLRLASVAGILFALASVAGAQPVVRVSVAQQAPLLAGQQVRIDVQVFVPNFFMGAPRFPNLEVPGAVITLTDDAVNLNDTIRGEAYAGIQRSYLLLASTAGTYSLPAAQISVTYAAVPGQPPATVGVALPRTDISIEWPAGMSSADAPDGMLVARVTVRQQLDRSDLSLRVGDALTRRLDVTAERTAAMFIPPPSFEAPSGIQVYPREPVVQNDTDGRGALVAGHRTDAAVYVFQRAGTFDLPAIDVAWYDIAARRARSATAPAITVTIAPSPATASIAPAAEAPPPPPPQRRNWRRTAAVGATGVLALGAAGWLGKRLPRWLRRYAAHRARVAASEPARFAHFERACRRGIPGDAYPALLQWMRCRPPGVTGDWRRTGHPSFEDQVRLLEEALFAPGAPTRWNGRALAAAAAHLRQPSRGDALPWPSRRLSALNPGSWQSQP